MAENSKDQATDFDASNPLIRETGRLETIGYVEALRAYNSCYQG